MLSFAKVFAKNILTQQIFLIERFLNIFDFTKETKIYFKRENNKRILLKINLKILNIFLIYKVLERFLINF